MKILERRWNMMERDGAEKTKAFKCVVCNNLQQFQGQSFLFGQGFIYNTFTLRRFTYATCSHLFASFSLIRFFRLE